MRGAVDFGLGTAPSAIQNPQPKIQNRPGFTLIELMMALTLLAVISGGIAMAFSTSLRTATAIQRRAEAAEERRALVERLRADLEGAWLRPESETTWFRALAAGGTGGSTSTGETDLLELTTTRPISIEAVRADEGADGLAGPQSDVAQVVWRVETLSDGSSALVRWERTPPDPQYLETQQLDPSQDPAMVRGVLMRGVTGFNLRFFDGTQWLEEWDTAPQMAGTVEQDTDTEPVGLPRAVEVTLFTGNGQAANQPRRLATLGAAEEPALTLTVALPEPIEAPLVQEVAP